MSRRLARLAGTIVLVAGGAFVRAAAADPPADAIQVRDLPATGGSWQEGSVVLQTPASEVRRWMSDYSSWPRIFPDVEWAQALGTAPDGRRVVRFHSRIAGRTITLHVREQAWLITYDGEASNVTTQGRTWVEALPGGRTRVRIQTTSQVHGFLGMFATDDMKRDRTREKLRADLDALSRLSRTYAALPRHPG